MNVPFEEQTKQQLDKARESIRKNMPEELVPRRNWFTVQTTAALLEQNIKKMRIIRGAAAEISILTRHFFKNDEPWKTFADMLTIAMEGGLPLVQYQLVDEKRLSGKILCEIVKEPGLSLKEVAKKLGINKEEILPSLKILQSQGLIDLLPRKKGTGYFITCIAFEIFNNLPETGSIQRFQKELWERILK